MDWRVSRASVFIVVSPGAVGSATITFITLVANTSKTILLPIETAGEELAMG
jgi:hypothetical protein